MPPCNQSTLLSLCAALQITFDWAWSKGPLSGSGNGALALQGGSLDEIFLVSKLQGTLDFVALRAHCTL
jgi:hypothetical protein